MAEVLTSVIQRRVVLADRVEQLRKELAETEAEVVRLEAAEVVIGQFIEGQTITPNRSRLPPAKRDSNARRHQAR